MGSKNYNLRLKWREICGVFGELLSKRTHIERGVWRDVQGKLRKGETVRQCQLRRGGQSMARTGHRCHSGIDILNQERCYDQESL